MRRVDHGFNVAFNRNCEIVPEEGLIYTESVEHRAASLL